MNHDGSQFHSGCAIADDLLYFSKQSDALMASNGPNSSFFRLDGEDWVIYDEAASWPALSMATTKPQGGLRTVVAVGPAGQYWELEPLSMQESLGEVSRSRPVRLRRVRAIGDDIVAAGMGRAVLQRRALDHWVDMGPAPPLNDLKTVGFEDIGGFSADEWYAIGWLGEIWQRTGNQWRQVDSPVSANLNAMTCAADGLVYAVGDNGTMIVGREDTWRVLDTGRAENLMGVGVHSGQVYVVTDFKILRLDGDELVADQNFADEDRPASCLHLLECPNALFSMGPTDLFRLTDGAWERLV